MATGKAEKEPSDYVTLVSSDGFEFLVLRSCANVAGLIKRMLDPQSMSYSFSASKVLYDA